MKAAATGSRRVGVSCVVLVCCGLLAVSAAAISVSAAPVATVSSRATLTDRAVAALSATRTLKFVYAGKAFVLNRQHVDNRPGHGGSAYDDTYTTQVKWSIAWEVTIEDGRALVGAPTATVSGTDSAEVKSAGHSSCSGPVAVPVVNGRPFIRTNFVILGQTQQFLTIRLEGFPPGWATSPSCDIAASGYVPQPPGPAGVTWVNSWGAPEFKVALLNNYKITPASIGGTYQYPLPPNNMWKKVTFDWNARLTIEGFTKGTTTTTPTPTPPAKKPCKPGVWPTGETTGAFLKRLKQMDATYEQQREKAMQKLYDQALADERAAAAMRESIDRLQSMLPTLLAQEEEAALDFEEKQEVYECFPDLIGVGIHVSDRPQNEINVEYHADIKGTPDSIFADSTITDAKAFASGQPFQVKLTTSVRRSGKPTSTATATINIAGIPRFGQISSVTINGTPQNPSIVVKGTNLGSKPAPNPSGSPSNQPLCPVVIKGNAGLDYGTSLYLNDNTGNFAAGRYRPTLNELDCIGLIVTKFTPTEIDLRPGSAYQQFSPKYQLNDGDSVEFAINGASKTVHVKYGTAVSN